MSSFSAYCLNCGEVIRRVEHDEVAFCTLACQTRALLAVAEAQAASQDQLDQQEQAFGGLEEDGSNPGGGCTSVSETASKTPLQTLSDRQGGGAAAQACNSGTFESPVPAATSTKAVAAVSARKPVRPPLHSRYSLAVVNNLVPSSSLAPTTTTTTTTSLQHPIMNSLRSDIFSISSVAHPHAARSLGAGAPRGSRLDSSSITQAASRIAPSSSTQTSSNLAHSTQPSFFASPLSPIHSELDPCHSTATTEAMYRQHYPKFANRRHLREHSPNKPPRTSNGDLTSSSPVTSDVQLLTPPPSVIRPLLILPEVSTDSGSHPPHPTPSPNSHTLLNGHSPMGSSQMNEPALASPLLRHTPERRSAPRRSLDISPSMSMSEQTEPNGGLTVGTEIASQAPPLPSFTDISHILRPSGSRGRSETSVTNGNSLGLDIQHVESVKSPPVSSCSTPSVHDVDENLEPASERYLSVSKTKTSNPVSPPKLRSRLISMHTAPTGARRELNGSDGWRSVEASRYTLGPREANYIVKKLSEEQKKRQLKEKAAAKEEAMETRGRSRVRKRAGSWGNSLALTQSMT
ncbi:hypothetical protein P389DRAFT_102600 [Cystobasidium minutum MCA 4210]|uniref:uncharacterized protein n=1 Tax=Cystobasidium minutum MCA 4210 TaxID=1397322 RepID=UPI0034CD4334|eukprot:jgi/Rhomi1/102600/CE102599_644